MKRSSFVQTTRRHRSCREQRRSTRCCFLHLPPICKGWTNNRAASGPGQPRDCWSVNLLVSGGEHRRLQHGDQQENIGERTRYGLPPADLPPCLQNLEQRRNTHPYSRSGCTAYLIERAFALVKGAIFGGPPPGSGLDGMWLGRQVLAVSSPRTPQQERNPALPERGDGGPSPKRPT